MKFNFKKKVIAITGLGVAGITVASTTSVLTAYKDDITKTQSAEVVAPVENEENTGVDSNPDNVIVSPAAKNSSEANEEKIEEDWSQYRNGTMAASVVSRISEINLDFKTAKANSYGLEQNYVEYADNGNFSNYSTSVENFKTDLYLFIDSFWNENDKNFDILSFSIDNFIVSGKNINKIILGSSVVSFELNVEISAFKDTKLVLFNKIFDLAKGETSNLKISVNNQTVMPVINELTTEFYLGWEINSANFEFKDESITKVLSPTKNSYSYAFQYIFDDLTDKKNYVELYKTFQPKILDMDTTKVKEKIVNYYNQQLSETLDYVDMGIQIIGILKENPNIENLLIRVAPYLAKIATKLNILPAFLEPLLAEGFANNKTSFISVFEKNKKAVIDYIAQYMPDLVDLAKPIIEAIGPNMNAEQMSELKSLLVYFGLDNKIIDILVNDFLGENGKPKSLYNILIDNVDTIVSLVISQNNNDVVEGILGIIELFTRRTLTYNLLRPVLSVIFDGNTNRQNFMYAIGRLVNLTAVWNVIEIMFINNDLAGLDTIQGILNSIYNFASQVFARKANYKDYKTGYENLEFSGHFDKEPTIDKQSQTINFKYLSYLKIKKKITLDLTPIKRMFDPNSVWNLINSFQDISGYGWAINKGWLRDGVVRFIPDSISVGGTSTSFTEITYEAQNSSLYFDPIQSNSDYTLGFKFDYKTRIAFKDQSLISSITNNYTSYFDWKQIGPILVWGDYYYSDFWRSILSNVITRDYVFTSIAHVEYSSEVVANTLTYDPNLYTTGFTITRAPQDKRLNGQSIYKDVSSWPNFYIFESVDTGALYNVRYSDTGDYYEKIIARTPTIPYFITDRITKNNYSITENWNYLASTNLAVRSYSDALFNFKLPIHIVIKYIVGKTDVQANIDFFAMNHQLYLPFMYYDTASKKMVDSYSEGFSQINNKVDSVGSWFWESKFYS